MKFVNRGQAVKETGLSYLGTVNSSQKILKNKKVSNVITYIIYLAPAKQSGYDVCEYSTVECRMGCLATSGHAGMELKAGLTVIKKARIKKTRLFFEEQDFFMEWVIAEIRAAQRKAIKDGFYFSVRLNGTSDIDWAKVIHRGKNIFAWFPEVQFYDYTKQASKFYSLAANYHLTFSYTGKNWNSCKALLDAGHNVAVVFNVKNEADLPKTWNGYPVVNGDLTDYRIADAKGIIVGLKFKRIANKKAEGNVLNSCFVVQPESTNIVDADGKEILVGDILPL